MLSRKFPPQSCCVFELSGKSRARRMCLETHRKKTFDFLIFCYSCTLDCSPCHASPMSDNRTSTIYWTTYIIFFFFMSEELEKKIVEKSLLRPKSVWLHHTAELHLLSTPDGQKMSMEQQLTEKVCTPYKNKIKRERSARKLWSIQIENFQKSFLLLLLLVLREDSLTLEQERCGRVRRLSKISVGLKSVDESL